MVMCQYVNTKTLLNCFICLDFMWKCHVKFRNTSFRFLVMVLEECSWNLHFQYFCFYFLYLLPFPFLYSLPFNLFFIFSLTIFLFVFLSIWSPSFSSFSCNCPGPWPLSSSSWLPLFWAHHFITRDYTCGQQHCQSNCS